MTIGEMLDRMKVNAGKLGILDNPVIAGVLITYSQDLNSGEWTSLAQGLDTSEMVRDFTADFCTQFQDESIKFTRKVRRDLHTAIDELTEREIK